MFDSKTSLVSLPSLLTFLWPSPASLLLMGSAWSEATELGSVGSSVHDILGVLLGGEAEAALFFCKWQFRCLPVGGEREGALVLRLAGARLGASTVVQYGLPRGLYWR